MFIMCIYIYWEYIDIVFLISVYLFHHLHLFFAHPPPPLSGAGTGGGVTSADFIQEQWHRAGREVSGQERSGPVDEVHLQRLREALGQQQRHPAPVARKGQSWTKETWSLWSLFHLTSLLLSSLSGFRCGGSGLYRTGADCKKVFLNKDNFLSHSSTLSEGKPLMLNWLKQILYDI